MGIDYRINAGGEKLPENQLCRCFVKKTGIQYFTGFAVLNEAAVVNDNRDFEAVRMERAVA